MKTPLGAEVDLGPGHIVLDGDPSPPREMDSSPNLFSAHVYCGHSRPSQLLLSSLFILLVPCCHKNTKTVLMSLIILL